MVKLTIDFETRSEADLKKVGAWEYAKHPSTEVICMAYKINTRNTGLWVCPDFAYGNNYAGTWVLNFPDFDIIEAHNAMFERAMWEEICVKRYGWPEIPVEKWRCSASKAAAMSLPRSLDNACKALNLPHQKDKEGYFLMMKMCKPRKALKADKAKYPDWESRVFWHETPEDLDRLFKYCKKDVDAEHGLSSALPDLSPNELKVWQMDQEINTRGVYIDTETCKNALFIVEELKVDMFTEVDLLTDGKVTSVTQVAKLLEYLEVYDLKLPNLKKATVEKALTYINLSTPARRLLELRQSLSKSSTAKLTTFINRAGEDSRARDIFLYHGASTGRWAGRSIQTQNMPRGNFKDVEACIDLINLGSIDHLRWYFGDPMAAISSCIRGLCSSPEGKDLICVDFKSIEARAIAWLANEGTVLRAFKSGLDLYEVAAAGIYNVEYDDVTEIQRQVGKVAILALGYQGGWRAFKAMADGYDIKPPDDVMAMEFSDRMYRKEKGRHTKLEVAFKHWAVPIVRKWRENNKNIVQYWWDTESSVQEVISYGEEVPCGNVTWGIKNDFLYCRLPSGRCISYYKPSIKEVEIKRMDKEGNLIMKNGIVQTYIKEGIYHMGMGGKSGNKWMNIGTYGGKLVENVTQAVARDLQAEAMLRLESAGYPIVMHLHDEATAEVDKDFGSLEEFEIIMAQVPDWAWGLPVGAVGWRGERYRK